jgi:hypothetical protein
LGRRYWWKEEEEEKGQCEDGEEEEEGGVMCAVKGLLKSKEGRKEEVDREEKRGEAGKKRREQK